MGTPKIYTFHLTTSVHAAYSVPELSAGTVNLKQNNTGTRRQQRAGTHEIRALSKSRTCERSVHDVNNTLALSTALSLEEDNGSEVRQTRVYSAVLCACCESIAFSAFFFKHTYTRRENVRPWKLKSAAWSSSR